MAKLLIRFHGECTQTHQCDAHWFFCSLSFLFIIWLNAFLFHSMLKEKEYKWTNGLYAALNVNGCNSIRILGESQSKAKTTKRSWNKEQCTKSETIMPGNGTGLCAGRAASYVEHTHSLWFGIIRCFVIPHVMLIWVMFHAVDPKWGDKTLRNSADSVVIRQQITSCKRDNSNSNTERSVRESEREKDKNGKISVTFAR